MSERDVWCLPQCIRFFFLFNVFPLVMRERVLVRRERGRWRVNVSVRLPAGHVGERREREGETLKRVRRVCAYVSSKKKENPMLFYFNIIILKTIIVFHF